MALRENKKAKAPQLRRVLTTNLGRGIRAATGAKGSKHRKTAPIWGLSTRWGRERYHKTGEMSCAIERE